VTGTSSGAVTSGIQVTMKNDSGGVDIFHVEFRDNPRNLFVVGTDSPGRYVEAPAPTCP
jgi:hypothetical protein